MTSSTFTFFDRLCLNADKALRTLTPGVAKATRENPANRYDEAADLADSRHIAGLMRINHTGEVCAQALYQGQASTAKLPAIAEAMNHAAEEEIDHLAWCEQRLRQLNSQPSVLNPLFYGLSFGIGAAAGLVGDKYSLGFVAATEDQVCQHLQEHLEQIDRDDQRSRAILQQMLVDEEQHATLAIDAGGLQFPQPVKQLMSLAAKCMTATTYRV
jgi:ubiquinone biosynthesis monooxygenase Coq7